MGSTEKINVSTIIIVFHCLKNTISTAIRLYHIIMHWSIIDTFFIQPFGEATLGKTGLVVIPILVSFSTFGAANGAIYITSRLIFGAARDHLLPEFLSSLHTKFRTPVPAIILLVS